MPIKNVLELGNLSDIANYIAEKHCNIKDMEITIPINDKHIFDKFKEDITIRLGGQKDEDIEAIDEINLFVGGIKFKYILFREGAES